jgi:hypothetical protein
MAMAKSVDLEALNPGLRPVYRVDPEASGGRDP